MSNIESALLDLGGLDILARRPTPIQRLDPRAKVLVALAFIVTVVSFGKYEVAGLLPLVAYPVALVIVGDLPAGYLLGKLLVASPFALLIGMFNPLLDQSILMEVGPARVSGGWISFASIMLRFGLTVSAALILIATTGFYPVCLALRRLRVPRVLTVQFMLLYRYVFVLGEEAARMARAWSLRAVNARGMPPSVFGSLAGQLLLRALDRAQRLHMAMLARGFDGEIRQAGALRFTAADAVFALGWTAFFIVARCYNLPHLMGGAVMP